MTKICGSGFELFYVWKGKDIPAKSPLGRALAQTGELRQILKNARHAWGLSLRDFAKASGLSASTLSHFERGEEVDAISWWTILYTIQDKAEERQRNARSRRGKRRVKN